MLPDINHIACHDMTFYMTHGHLLVNLGRSHRELRGTPPVDPFTLSQGSRLHDRRGVASSSKNKTASLLHSRVALKAECWQSHTIVVELRKGEPKAQLTTVREQAHFAAISCVMRCIMCSACLLS